MPDDGLSASVEYAKSSRGRCARCKCVILQGCLRIGKQFNSSHHSGENKFHLKCFKHSFTTSASETLFGFESLKPADQEKVSNHWDGKETPKKSVKKSPSPSPSPSLSFDSVAPTIIPVPTPASSFIPSSNEGSLNEMKQRMKELSQSGVISHTEELWLCREIPLNPKVRSIIKAALKLYEIDHDRQEFSDTLKRLVKTHY